MSKVYGKALLDEMIRQQALPMSLSKQAGKEIPALIQDLILEGLVKDGVVRISNFGSFRLKPVAERKGYNPQTKERMILPAHQRVTFAPCKALRELIEPERRPAQPIEAQPIQAEPKTGSDSQAANAAKPAALKDTGLKVAAVKEESGSKARQVETPPIEEKGHKPDVPETIPTPKTGAGKKNNTSKKYSGIVVAPLFVMAIVTASLLYDSGLYESGKNSKRLPADKLAADTEIEAPAATPDPAAGSGQAEHLAHKRHGIPIPQADEVGRTSLITPQRIEVTKGEAENKDTGIQHAKVQDAEIQDAKIQDLGTQIETGTKNETPHNIATAGDITPRPVTFYFNAMPHKVAREENLWQLAATHYKDPWLWPHIYQANAGIISDPDRLREGQSILLPELQGNPENLSNADRRHIAEAYHLLYLHYKKTGRKDAFFALLQARRYDNQVMEQHREQL